MENAIQKESLSKFVRFTKMNSATREVSGVVTAEAPDKDFEVCDYAASKPYYEKVISELGKATDGMNYFPLREMHGLKAAGKCTAFHFNDADKEIEMTFKVVDDDAWKKCEERVYTGFSQGGRKVGDQVPDPVYKGCMRYVANPSEVSLVDNPCLPDAHFAYVKADGSVEMRKFLKTEVPPDAQRIEALEREVTLLKAAAPVVAVPVLKTELDKKTKTVSGKALPASDFAYVGDPEKTETWKLPIHDASHVRNALARLNQTKGIPSGEKGKVRAKINAAAKKFGVDVKSEESKAAAILSTMRKAARVFVNTHSSKLISKNVQALDIELGKLTKGMFEVSEMARALEGMSWLVYAVAAEQKWEDDESSVPESLAENITALTETFLEMVDEEARELNEHVSAQVA